MPEQDDLKRVIKELRPARLLLVGIAERALEEYARGCASEVTVMTIAQAASLHFSKPFDLVIVGLHTADQDAATRAVLAALRDIHARRLLVLAPTAAKIDLSALGFTLLAEYTEPAMRLYGFELKHYKQTPEWLSAQYWANPEMWNKKRW